MYLCNMNKDKKFKELLEDFNSRKIEADSLDWQDNIPNDLHQKYFDGTKFKEVDEIEVESDRWCRIVTTVIEILGGYIGITHVSDVHNNNTGISDCLSHITVCEMKKSKKSTFKEV